MDGGRGESSQSGEEALGGLKLLLGLDQVIASVGVPRASSELFSAPAGKASGSGRSSRSVSTSPGRDASRA